jgi:hypothetical protein
MLKVPVSEPLLVTAESQVRRIRLQQRGISLLRLV